MASEDRTPLLQLTFGATMFGDSFASLPGDAPWPMVWVQGDGCPSEGPVEAQAYAVAGLPVRDITLDGRVLARAFEDEVAEYCYLGGVLPADANVDRTHQARSVLDRMETVLGQAGMDFSHVARTWFYNEHILDWYDEFNTVRTEFFDERKIFDGVVPASTGIGAGNTAGAALCGAAIAIKAKTEGLRVSRIDSPLQCSAEDYRSSFSRAVEVEGPGRRALYISGTASIAREGHSVHVGDIAGQIERTMEVAQAILHLRGMGWRDVSRMIAYFKHADDIPRFGEFLHRQGLKEIPVLKTQAAVCRAELLFEVELDAVIAG